jgi:DNA mismatch endonuclease, patch repair protein
MSKIRSKNTTFEEKVISVLNVKFPNKFVTHVGRLKGTPDIVFEHETVCVFLDSDFWHGWQYPRWKHLLTNEFCKEKITKNRQIDMRSTRILKKQGWKVIRIWEHEIKVDLDRQHLAPGVNHAVLRGGKNEFSGRKFVSCRFSWRTRCV